MKPENQLCSAEKIGVGASAVAERRQQFINIFRKEIYSLGVGAIQTQQMNKFTRRKLAKTVAVSEELQKGSIIKTFYTCPAENDILYSE